MRDSQRWTEALRARICGELTLGVMTPGMRFASVRSLAAEMKTGSRTIAAALQQLADEGLVEIRERSGVYLADGPAAQRELRFADTNWWIDVVSGALARGVPIGSIGDFVSRTVSRVKIRAVVLECNDDQLFSIRRDLEHNFGLDASSVDLDRLEASSSDRALVARADVLISTPYHMEPVMNIGRRYGIPTLFVTLCSDLFESVAELLPARKVCFVVTDDRLRDKLVTMMSRVKGNENFSVRVHGQDSLQQITPDSSIYFTNITRTRLRNTFLPSQVLREKNIFSDQSAREVVRFMIEFNAARIGGPARESADALKLIGLKRPGDVNASSRGSTRPAPRVR